MRFRKKGLDQIRAAVLASKSRMGPPCSVCALPAEVLALVVDLKAEGHSYAAIAKGLSASGYRLTGNRIGHHLREHGAKA